MTQKDISILLEREKRWLLDEKYDGVTSDAYLADVALLVDGTPVDYLIGHREFIGCHIDLSHHPLIPRNETEYWTKNLVDTHVRGPAPNMCVLDMCAGSGCIGIALLKNLPQVTVDFAELNPKFIEQIQTNLDLNNIDPARYTITQSDLFDNLPEKQYDMIVTNPPYIANDRRETVQDSVHDHEDHSSLYSNDDGLEHIKCIVDALPQYLKPGATCHIEFDPWQAPLLDEFMTTKPNLTHTYTQDQFNKNRVMRITKIS